MRSLPPARGCRAQCVRRGSSARDPLRFAGLHAPVSSQASSGCLRFVEQPARGGARFFRDGCSRQHARDLFDPFVMVEQLDARAVGFARDAEMAFGARGDLRRMGDEQYLRVARKTLQPFAHGIGDRAAHAAIDFVEHERGRRTGTGERNFERQRKAREFAARGDLDQRAESRAFDRRHFEAHLFQARRTSFVAEIFERDAEARMTELERRQLAGDGLFELRRRGLARGRQISRRLADRRLVRTRDRPRPPLSVSSSL